MSRLGKKEITIPKGVTVTQKGDIISVKGPKGEVSRTFLQDITITVTPEAITLVPRGTANVFNRSLWGTYWSHLRNMVVGVTDGYSQKLLIEGTGYKWDATGTNIKLALGFSHPVNVPIPSGITVKSEKTELNIAGIDKEAVGSFAAYLRSLKKPEPYKGKGIRYEGEVIERKQGKRSTT